MSERTEGVYNGTWCAICETPFVPPDIGRAIRNTAERAHECCMSTEYCEHFKDAS